MNAAPNPKSEPVTGVSDEILIQKALNCGVPAKKLTQLDNETRLLILKMVKLSGKQKQLARARLFTKVNYKPDTLGKEKRNKLARTLKFLCLENEIDVSHVTMEEYTEYLNRARKGRQIVSSMAVMKLSPSEFLTAEQISVLQKEHLQRVKERKISMAAKKDKKVSSVVTRKKSPAPVVTAFEQWQKELEGIAEARKLHVEKTPQITLDTGFVKPMPSYLERTLKRSARKAKRFSTRSKYQRPVSNKDRFFEDAEIDFIFIRPNPADVSLCPRPEKNAYATRNQAKRFIKTFYPHDKEMHHYECDCGALHIGH